MAKLSDAQINALKFYANSEGKAPQERTRTSLLKNGFLNEDNTLTDDAYDALGWERPGMVVDEISELLSTNPWDAVQFADHGDVGLSAEKIEEIFSPLDIVLPAGWDMRKRNREAWEGLTQEEINADIATARPVANRADIRSGNVLKSKYL